MGTTNERLHTILTAVRSSNYKELDKDTQKRIDKDIEIRTRIEKRIEEKFIQHINFSMTNFQLYSAVDLAMDAAPINKATYPMMMYAQGKLKKSSCLTQLASIPAASQYLVKNAEGRVSDFDIPQFLDVNVNLVKSFVTRRLAPQSNKYSNLFPYYKYESRSTSDEGKLRADVMSQLADIMSDQFNYRHHDVQVMRDMFIYARCLDFVRSSWEEERQLAKKDYSLEFSDDNMTSVIVREGVDFINPHPSRVFWDIAYPLANINTDTGPEYCGFWDVVKAGDVMNHPLYFNRDRIMAGSDIINIWSVYQEYFNQYFCTIKIPNMSMQPDLTSGNDRTSLIGIYNASEKDSSVFLTQFYWKMIPKDWCIGNYPCPIWIRFVMAGNRTAVFSEIMPSRPAAYMGLNENDNRAVNISFAHEIMPYQDQMTNLLTQLLRLTKSDCTKVVMIDKDAIIDAEDMKKLTSDLQAKNYYAEPIVVKFSGLKLRDIGVNQINPVRWIETTPSQAISIIFRAMGELVALAERLTAMSPNEVGQPAPREISATETNQIASTTTSVYSFISDAIDEYRAAKKIIIYESLMAKGSKEQKATVIERYTKETIEKAGFELADNYGDQTIPRKSTVIGQKHNLIHDYIFTTRDGAERPSNQQAATNLVQLMVGIMQDPSVRQALGKRNFVKVVNEILRLSGTGLDLIIEVPDDEPDTFPEVPQPGAVPAPVPAQPTIA